MALKYYIADSFELNQMGSKGKRLFYTDEKKTVTEEKFYETLDLKVKEITKKQPEKYDEVYNMCKDHLTKTKTSITVLDTFFIIKGK